MLQENKSQIRAAGQYRCDNRSQTRGDRLRDSTVTLH